MSISENATGGENEPDMNVSENQENPQVVAAEIVEAVIEDTRDAGVAEETGAAEDSVAIETEGEVLKLHDEPSADADQTEEPANGFETLGLPREVVEAVKLSLIHI